MVTAALVIALAAWLAQFIAWRRAVVARDQLELQLRKLQMYHSITAHPALRDRPAPDWVHNLKETTND